MTVTERVGMCLGCDRELVQQERSPGIWRPLVCSACSSLPAPSLVAVHCPDCARADHAAELVRVPHDLSYQLKRFADRQPGDRVYLCDRCACCGEIWCVLSLRPAA